MTEKNFTITEIEKVVDKIEGNIPQVEWDFEKIHYFDNGPLTVQYIFVLDTLNFCFWPGMNNCSNLFFIKNCDLKIELNESLKSKLS